ncbi:MAG: hypothetical protein QGD94_11165, partial [Planctomycetia bacterium]|nr:hypothetical protein [Planctomycetia bacterium]
AFGLFDAGGTGFKPLAQAICQSIYLTASSDGKYIAFVALAAGDKGAKLEPEEGIKLVLCDIKTGKRDIVTAESGGWAAFSPDGETLAYTTTGGLFVKDIASGSPRQVTSNITTAIISQMGSSALIYPVWLSNTKLLFWRETATLGTAGKALTAFTATVTGSKPRNVQVRIDAAVATAISKSKKK